MKLIKRALASAAIASFVLAQPAAAATRSYESLPQSGVQHPVAVDRVGAPVADAEQARGRPVIVILLIFGALLALFAASGAFGHGKDSTG